MTRASASTTVLVALMLASSCANDDLECPATTSKVTVRTTGDPTWIYGKADDGEWSIPYSGSNRTFELCAVSSYEIVVACPDAFLKSRAAELAATPSETMDEVFSCPVTAAPPKNTVAVTGEVLTPAQVYLGPYSSFGTVGTWYYQLDVVPGTYDLVATDDIDLSFSQPSRRIAIRRAQSIHANVIEDNLDLATDGSAFATLNLNFNGAQPDDTISAATLLSTAHGAGYVEVAQTRGAIADTVPPELLVSDDGEYLDASLVSAAVGSRQYERGYGASLHGESSINADVLPRLTGVTFPIPDVAMWDALPAPYTRLSLELFAGAGVVERVTATSGWLDLHPGMTLSFDPSGPGFDPMWQVDTTAGHYQRTFTLSQYGEPALATSVIDTVN